MREANERLMTEKVSVLNIRQGYTKEKARSDLRSQMWAYIALRPISFYLTPLFINLGFSANAVTALSLILTFCGLVFILLGVTSPVYFIIGAGLFNISYLFDCVDGNIARYRGQSSEFGALFDSIAGLFYQASLPLCLGLGLYLADPEQVFHALGLKLPTWCWLMAGAVDSSSGLFGRVVGLKARRGAANVDGEQGDFNLPIWDVLPRAILSFHMPLLLIASLVGALDLFLFSYAVYSLLSLLAMIAHSLRKALLFDRQQTDKGRSL